MKIISLAATAPVATALAATALAATALADSGTITVSFAPNTAGAASALSIEAQGPFNVQGSPKSMTILTQPGFNGSPKSVATPCTRAQESGGSCPAASQIGSGTAVATGTVATVSQQDRISFTLYLGQPLQAGDLASLFISGSDTVLHQSAHATGRLLRVGGRMEMLFDQLPQFTPPAGTTVTLDSLSLHAQASRTVSSGKGKRRKRINYSLITNPAICTAAGWQTQVTVVFDGGQTLQRTLTSSCRPAKRG